LVINNNCTDETIEVVEKYTQKLPVPLKIITETKQGLHHARLCGVKKTNGDWIALVDDCLIGLLFYSFVQALVEFASSPRGTDIPSALTPVLGWWSAMWTMFRMNKKERNELLGGAV
jgi:glycosyltransferase involved in cell wall biosynthesis